MDIKEPAPQYHRLMSPEEYLAWERLAPAKHEYAEGIITDMAGASDQHNEILVNLIAFIAPFLKGKGCKIYPSDLRIYVPSVKSYFYPDSSIVCGPNETTDDIRDTIKNPSIIFEILSPSTAEYNLGKKFFYYMQIPSLKEYITIDSTRIQVRASRRNPDNAWTFDNLEEPGQQLFLKAVDLSIPLSELYDGIKIR